MNLVTYAGAYAVSDLCEDHRMSVCSLRACNDPFEVHQISSVFSDGIDSAIEAAIEKPSARSLLNLALEREWKVKPERFWSLYKEDRERFDSIGFKQLFHDLAFEERRISRLKALDDAFKVICCTHLGVTDDAEIAMWSYYGDRHQGIRIHFNPDFYDIPRIISSKIAYEKSPPIIGNFKEKENYHITLITTKADCWKHEEEVRIFIKNSDLTAAKDRNGVERFWVPIAKKDIIRIDLGMNFSEMSVWEAAGKLTTAFPDIQIFHTRRSYDAYKCEYSLIEPALIAHMQKNLDVHICGLIAVGNRMRDVRNHYPGGVTTSKYHPTYEHPTTTGHLLP